jgi:hypothetical protein
LRGSGLYRFALKSGPGVLQTVLKFFEKVQSNNRDAISGNSMIFLFSNSISTSLKFRLHLPKPISQHGYSHPPLEEKGFVQSLTKSI